MNDNHKPNYGLSDQHLETYIEKKENLIVDFESEEKTKKLKNKEEGRC
ncbi:hypothetical protein R4B61_04390 [Fructilactobacillus vespulae]